MGPLKHTTLCLGYRLEEHPRPGKFKPEAAKTLGIPYGPLWGKLQRGKPLPLTRRDSISQPCAWAPKARTEDLLRRRYAAQQGSLSTVSGCGFGVPRRNVLTEHHEEAEAKGHMTADDAARVAARAGARRAVLAHISPRYTEGDMEKFAEAAKKRFENTEIGSDLQQFAIPYREEDPNLPQRTNT